MLQKPSTRDGFRPPVPRSPYLYREATACVRLDGRLDDARLQPRLRNVTYGTTRLGNIVSSFQIEGIHVDLAQAARALAGRKGRTPYEKDVASFGRLYDELNAADPLPRLTPETIRAWHERLFEPGSLDHGKPGEWKKAPNGVWNVRKNDWVFLATPPEDTVAELEALLRWNDGDARLLPPPIAAGIFFAEFECIHPFADGNGRLGRLLHLYALKHHGMRNAFLAPIDERFLASRDRYYAALESTNRGDSYEAWAGYHLEQLLAAYERAHRMGRLDEVMGQLPRPSAQGILQWALTHAGESWFRRGDYPNEEELSDATLTLALADLQKMGVLEARGEKKGRRYRLAWDAIEAMQAVPRGHNKS